MSLVKIKRLEWGGRGWSGNYITDGLVNTNEVSTITRVDEPPRGINESCVKVKMKNGEEFIAKGIVDDFLGD